MSCKINLDGGSIVSTGTTIYGTLTCDIRRNTDIREIRCILKGKEKTSFKKGKTNYIGRNDFLVLIRKLNGEDTLRGSYQFQFMFDLPADLPCSFEDDTGCVKYSIKATVDIPFSIDITDKLPLTVKSPVNLNLCNGVVQERVGYEWEETIDCFCFSSGGSKMLVALDKGNAYLPGDTIKSDVYISNLSSKNVSRVEASFTRIRTYKGSSDVTKRDKMEYDVLVFSGLGPNSENNYSFQYKIPENIIPQNLFTCKHIKEEYILRVRAVYPLFYDSLIVDVNILLGQIALQGY